MDSVDAPKEHQTEPIFCWGLGKPRDPAPARRFADFGESVVWPADREAIHFSVHSVDPPHVISPILSLSLLIARYRASRRPSTLVFPHPVCPPLPVRHSSDHRTSCVNFAPCSWADALDDVTRVLGTLSLFISVPRPSVDHGCGGTQVSHPQLSRIAPDWAVAIPNVCFCM